MIKLIVTVCAISGPHAGECNTQTRVIQSMRLCRFAEAAAHAAIDRKRLDGNLDATYELSCVNTS
jgi:hypothetical protein